MAQQDYLNPVYSGLGEYLKGYMGNKLRSGLPSYYANPAKNQIAQAYNSRMNALRQAGTDRGAGGSGSMYNAMATLDTGRIGALGNVMSDMALKNLGYQQSMLQGLMTMQNQEANRGMQTKQMQQQDYWNQRQMEAQESGFGDFLGGVVGTGIGALTGGIGGTVGGKLAYDWFDA